MRPAKAVEDFASYRDVWVIVEQRQHKVQDVTLELLGAGRPMADKREVRLIAVLLADDPGEMPQELVAAGADAVVVARHPILRTPLARPSADVLTRLIKERRPEIVLIGATHTGRDISSRVAVKVDAGMTADCTELDVDDAGGELLARRPAFGGKMLATIRCDRHRPQMATARPGIFKPLEPDTSRRAEVEEVDVSWLRAEDYAAEVLDHVVHHGVDITKAEVLVAGGLGIGGPEGFEDLERLAEALGGDVACSRPVADKGWVGRDRQVGQTGVSVRPKLYVAVGVSGAIQHIEGMKESGTVIAINNDASAPIFQYADVGIVGDWRPTVKALTEEARKRGLAEAKWMLPRKDTLDADRQAARERALKAAKKEAAEQEDAPATGQAHSAAKQEAADGAAPQDQNDAAAAASKTDPLPSRDAPTAGSNEEAGGATTAGAGAEGSAATYDGDPSDQDAVRAWVAKHVPEERKAWVVAADCIVCNGCEAACPTGAAIITDLARVDRDLCIADGGCFDACPTDAIRPGIEDAATTAGWPEGSRLAGQIGA